MAYNKVYYYKKIIKIQEIVFEKQALGIPLIRIYRDYIEWEYDISYSTFSNYLAVPAKAKLKKLENKNKNPKK